MKTSSIFSGVLVAGVLFASTAALAAPQPFHNRVDVNIPQLEMRIDAGIKSGKLTPTEAHQLRTELRQLGTSVKTAMKDRKITKWERTSLESKEAALNRHITKLSNNKSVVSKHPVKPGFDHRMPFKPDQGRNWR